MGIASTKQALMSKPRLTLNKSARKSARKHRERLLCACFADMDISIGSRWKSSCFTWFAFLSCTASHARHPGSAN
jgi:hypothetical protein